MKKSMIILVAILAIGISLHYLRIDQKQEEAAVRDELPAKSRQMDLNYGLIPMHFEPNLGQAGEGAKFLARGHGYTLFLTSTEAVLALWKAEMEDDKQEEERRADHGTSPQSRTLRMKLMRANPESEVEALGELPGRTNYFIGSDPDKWRTGVPNYAKVKYKGIYPGVDLLYYGNQRELEYDFVVAPGADPRQIALDFEGADNLYLDESGNLALRTETAQVTLRAPVVYQETSDGKQSVAGNFEMRGENRIGFRIGAYDAGLPLVIDPVVVYSSHLGGSELDYSKGIAVDAAGNAYVGGTTASPDFPLANPLQNDMDYKDAFVSKISADGSALVYSTYIGGDSLDWAEDIAIDDMGNVYLTGKTQSDNFPVANAFQSSLAVRRDTTRIGDSLYVKITSTDDVFITKLSTDGASLVYSTYLGGSGHEGGRGIAVDASGNAYVTGETGSEDFPTANPFQSTRGPKYYDTFVTKLGADGSSLVYSTYLGGSDHESSEYNPIAVDFSGNAVVIGHTQSDDFPLVNPLQNTNKGGIGEAFVVKFRPDGSPVFSTYFGGSDYDAAHGVALDVAGNTYITGETWSADFPLVNAFQNMRSASNDAFVTKLNPDGSAFIYSTLLGGNGGDLGGDIAVDVQGNAYIVGITTSMDFPVVNGFQSTRKGIRDLFVVKFSSDGSALTYSTYLGGSGSEGWAGGSLSFGITLDVENNIYVSSSTTSDDFPTTPGVFQQGYAGNEDVVVSKISLDEDKLEIIRITPDPLTDARFWVERTLRPGERWTFRTHFRYTLVSADSGVVRMEVETRNGIFLGEESVEVKRAKDALKLNFKSPEVTIPEVPVDEVDTLYVKLKLFPTNEPDATAKDSVFYRIFIHKWTFMVYLDGDNDLEWESVDDFLEMAEVPSNDSLAVVMQYDRHPGYDNWWFDPLTGEWSEEYGWEDTRRIFNHQDYYREDSMGELNMGHPATLRNFVQWAMKKFPAQHYALVLWDHGGGWRAPEPSPLAKTASRPEFPQLPPGGSGRRGNYKDVVVDETDNDVLYSAEIRQALSELPKLDILGFDACLMGMVENAYQYRHAADYMVGSEALEPGDGWPYHTILARLKARPELTGFGLSHVIVEEYGFFYPSDEPFVTQSAVNLWEMEQIREALDELAGLLISRRPWGAVKSALKQVKAFWPVPHRDLYHFAQILKTTSLNQEIQSACDKLLAALDKAVIANYHSSAEENANGLAIFFPKVMAEYDASYDWVNNIQLSDDTQWDEFLRLFLSPLVIDTYELNDWLTQAYGPLFPETAYYSYFPHPGDRDFYFITTGQETHLSVLLTSPSGVNWDVAAFDPNGTLLGRSLSTTPFDTLSLAALPPGSYYIEVISNGIALPEVPYKLEVDYQGSRSGRVRLSSDDGVPDSSLFSTEAGDVIGMAFHAHTYPMRLDEISFYIESIDGAGSGGDGSFYVWLADYFGTIVEPFPVTPVFGSVQKSSQSSGWFTMTLSDSAIMLQSDFVVGIGYDGQNTPTLGVDSVDNGRTFQWDSATRNWRALEAAAFIRATVSYLETPDRVRISLPAELHVKPDDTMSVPIEISDLPAAGVDSLDLEVYYEPSALRFEAIGRENTLTSDWQVDSLDSVPAGRILIQMSRGSKISTAGVLLNLLFRVQPEAAIGDTVELLFNHARLNGGAYAVETRGGHIIVTTSTAVRETRGQPEEFAIAQNYPNPFNPETTIRYDLPKPSEVRIEIFNLLGQKIRTLVDAPKPAGSYTVVWDGRDQSGRQVSSGVYLVKMQVSQNSGGRFVKVRKMALVK